MSAALPARRRRAAGELTWIASAVPIPAALPNGASGGGSGGRLAAAEQLLFRVPTMLRLA